MQDENYRVYKVWDLPTRLFHWINFLAVMGLIVFGMLMLFKGELGIESLQAKIALKTVHVLFGYVFALNLTIRLIWAFVGSPRASWREVLPERPVLPSIRAYVARMKDESRQPYLGHNPLGRLAVLVMFLVMIILMVTGLVRAGTDIYYPPFGGMAAEYVAAPGVDPATVLPYDKTGVDEQKYAELKAFKKPFGVVHLYLAWFMIFMIVLHIAAVIHAEIKQDGTLVSAMFTGRKIVRGAPRDPE